MPRGENPVPQDYTPPSAIKPQRTFRGGEEWGSGGRSWGAVVLRLSGWSVTLLFVWGVVRYRIDLLVDQHSRLALCCVQAFRPPAARTGSGRRAGIWKLRGTMILGNVHQRLQEDLSEDKQKWGRASRAWSPWSPHITRQGRGENGWTERRKSCRCRTTPARGGTLLPDPREMASPVAFDRARRQQHVPHRRCQLRCRASMGATGRYLAILGRR